MWELYVWHIWWNQKLLTQKFCCSRLAPLTCPRDEDGPCTIMLPPPPWPKLHVCAGQAEHVDTRPQLRALGCWAAGRERWGLTCRLALSASSLPQTPWASQHPAFISVCLLLFFCFCLFCGAGEGTQGLTHAGQVLCHWATPQTFQCPSVFLWSIEGLTV